MEYKADFSTLAAGYHICRLVRISDNVIVGDYQCSATSGKWFATATRGGWDQYHLRIVEQHWSAHLLKLVLEP
jgi:hypothetical protein